MKRLGRVDAIGLTTVGLLVIGWWWMIHALFPQVEFVEWIASPAEESVRDGIDAIVTFRDDGFSRHVSLMWAAVTGRACGTDITCINTLAFLPVAGAAFAFYALARALRLPAGGAVAVVVVWLISAPAFEVLTWQATLHDRAAAFFVPVFLLIVLLALRTERTAPSLVAISLLLAGLALLTVNTKEPAWTVLPMLAAAPLLVSSSRRHALVSMAVVAPGVLLMTVHVLTDLNALAKDPASSGHVDSGSITDNLPVLTGYVAPGGWAVLELLAIPAVIGIVLAVRNRSRNPEAFEAARYAGWLTIGTLAGWAIPARTEYASAFYMFVPMAVAALAIACGLRALALLYLPETPEARRLATATTIAVVAVFAGVSAASRWEPYGKVIENDKNFRASLPQIDALHRSRPEARFQFRMEYPYGYRFATAALASRFWRVIGTQINPPDWETPITSIPDECGRDGTIVLRYDEKTRFLGPCP